MKTKGVLSLLLLLGVILAIFPLVLGSFSHAGIGFVNFLWMIPGLFFVVVSVVGLVFASLYVRAKGNLAYVRTGKGGRKVILDHGSIVISFLHEIIPVSLETMKIVVERKEKNSLITLDKLRAEVVAEFYIRVKADDNGIATAARTLGDKISAEAGGKRMDQMDSESLLQAQQSAINKLESEKLIDALRTVAAKSNLEDLNLKRDEFKAAVMQVVKDGLEQNGLELEDTTISALDQASMEIMDPNNTFDAQGLKNLQQVISVQSVARNEFEKNAELEIKKKNVETQKAVLEQDQDLEFKSADQQREVRTYKSEQDKQAREAELANEEAVGCRSIEKDKLIQVADVQSQEEVAIKGVKKDEAIATSNVSKEKAVEIAERDRQIAIAEKEADRAAAEEKRQQAEAKAEKARQDVKTVEVTETANREKLQKVIDKEAEVKQERIKKEMEADVQAYATAKDAEGRKEAAQADFEAKTKAAEANFITKQKAAEGDKAQQMVPVEVAAKQVEVDQAKVAVLKQELEAKSANEKIAMGLQIQLAEISANQEVGKAFAQALGDGLASANMTIWGDANAYKTISQAFMRGQSNGNFLAGLLESTPASVTEGIGELKDGATSAMTGLGGMIGGILEKLSGSQLDAEALQKILTALQKEKKSASTEEKSE